MTDSQLAFVSEMRSAAMDVGASDWIASWFAAVACLESGWGRYIPADSHNPIGYHWLPGTGWDFAVAKEGMTGNAQRYRKFRDLHAAARSWLYLVHKSSIPAYVAARVHSPGHTEPERYAWMLAFSKGYCPADPQHGVKVTNIYRRIERGLLDDR